MIDEVTYIAETARNVSERIERDLASTWPLEVRRLAEDVAWIARQVARLADQHVSKEHPAPERS